MVKHVTIFSPTEDKKLIAQLEKDVVEAVGADEAMAFGKAFLAYRTFLLDMNEKHWEQQYASLLFQRAEGRAKQGQTDAQYLQRHNPGELASVKRAAVHAVETELRLDEEPNRAHWSAQEREQYDRLCTAYSAQAQNISAKIIEVFVHKNMHTGQVPFSEAVIANGEDYPLLADDDKGETLLSGADVAQEILNGFKDNALKLAAKVGMPARATAARSAAARR